MEEKVKYLVTAEEMRRYDSYTIKNIGIPARVLMERAALAALEAAERFAGAAAAQTGHFGGAEAGGSCEGGKPGGGTAFRRAGEKRTALVMAGTGNNGGDGLALARLLASRGYAVEVWCVGSLEKATEQWKSQRAILENYSVKFCGKPAGTEYTVIIDALFGVGLCRELTGSFREAVEIFNGLRGWKLALDIPSGVDADTGRIWGEAVRADATVTFGFWKRGLVLYPGCERAGEVTLADIGISPMSFQGEAPRMYALEGDPWELLPKRDPAGHKGTFGKVLLAAGSRNMAGAAILAARAAYRAGAGMVKVITPEENRVILQTAVPEALLGTPEDLEKSLNWADVAAVGPGLGQDETALSCLSRIIRESRLPLVIDADGLNLLSCGGDLARELSRQGEQGRSIVLTPHVGELARLAGMPAESLREDISGEAQRLSARIHGTVAAKDARTFICREGDPICVNLGGNSGMATAGSGDVLTGVIAGLMAQGMDGYRAACVGVYVHGAAGDRASARLGPYACTAGDLISNLCIPPKKQAILIHE